MRLLVVEDEEALRQMIVRRLTQEGYSVDGCGDGRESLHYAEAAPYDCILLDVMLPGMDGIEVLRTLRAKGAKTPVLLLTARDSIGDRVTGLDAGADDYLTKPFSFDELSARVRALLRRHGEEKQGVLTAWGVTLDPAARRAEREGRVISLTAKEFALLEYLVRNKGRVVTRGQIVDHVWNYDFDCDSNIVDVYIRYLRRKVDAGFDRPLIHTIRGSGYALREEP